MLKLYGAPLSNYFNIVKTALLDKGVAFEHVMQAPGQDEAYLAKSPMGKIPCIETQQGFLAETHAILDYLEEANPASPLLPKDAFARAKVRELVQAFELYVDLVGRRGIMALFGKDVSDEVKESIARDLPRGLAAVKRLAKFDPWIAGPTFTYADIFGYWALGLAAISAQKNCGIDVFAGEPQIKAWYDRVGERPSVKKAVEERVAALKAAGR